MIDKIEFYRETNFKETELGELPEDWEVREMTEFVDFERGTEPGSDSYNKIGQGVRFIRVADLSGSRNDVIYTTSQNVKIADKQDILISFDGSPGIVQRNLNGAFSSGIRRVLFKNDAIDQDFTYFVLKTLYVQDVINKYSFGVTIKHASKSIGHLKIPLPPLPEQQAIADVLGIIQNAKEKIETGIDIAKKVKQIMMNHLFTYGVVPIDKTDDVKLKETEIGLIPEHWRVVRLGDYCRVIRGASPRPKGDPKYYGGHIPRLMVQDVTRDYKYIFPKIDFLTKEGAKKSRLLPKGTFIIQVSGNPGTPCILGTDACIHDGFAALIDLDKRSIDSEFLFYYFDYSKTKYKQLAFGAIFQNLQTYAIGNFLIPLPPLPEQKAIADVLQSIDNYIEKLKNAKLFYEKFFKFMLSNLMSGKIRIRVNSKE